MQARRKANIHVLFFRCATQRSMQIRHTILAFAVLAGFATQTEAQATKDRLHAQKVTIFELAKVDGRSLPAKVSVFGEKVQYFSAKLVLMPKGTFVMTWDDAKDKTSAKERGVRSYKGTYRMHGSALVLVRKEKNPLFFEVEGNTARFAPEGPAGVVFEFKRK